jgi:ABC-type ATPase with predicted acetyltransferase domain
MNVGLLLRVAAILTLLPLVWLYGLHWRDRRAQRIAAGRCATCGYSLTGNLSGICPECGTRVGYE